MATAVGGGGGERRQMKTTTEAAIAAAMAEEAVVATAAMAATVAEAMAVETERQKQRDRDIRYYLWPMLYVEQYYLANSGDILASFLAYKQIICKTDTDTRICIFRLRKYNLQIKKWSFCKFICVSRQQNHTFWQKKSQIVSTTQKDGAKVDTIFCKAYRRKKITA